MKCRYCTSELEFLLIDLGAQPPSNSYLNLEDLNKAEIYLPLKVFVCSQCFLVQTADFTSKETFFNDEYAYFSSNSRTWLQHAEKYVSHVIKQFELDETSFVIEIGSNDGYLLKNFLNRNIRCIGIEPTASTAAVGKSLGIQTIVDFYQSGTAHSIKNKYGSADLIICNNVYAHVPDINDFTEALEISLSENGVITIEFPHLLNLVEYCQFDTIYHEHFSYFSVQAVQNIFASKNLRIFKVEELTTHGGSLRIYGCKLSASHVTCDSVNEILVKEKERGLFDLNSFKDFHERAVNIKLGLIEFLLKAKKEGKLVCGYGAAAKGNTLLNFAGIKSDLLPFVGDIALSKINKFLPGSRIPIIAPNAIDDLSPDFVVILSWNIANEVKSQFPELVARGCKFLIFVPELREV